MPGVIAAYMLDSCHSVCSLSLPSPSLSFLLALLLLFPPKIRQNVNIKIFEGSEMPLLIQHEGTLHNYRCNKV